MRIFLDANVLFSAAKGNGAMRQLLGELKRRGDTRVADGYVVGEARRNLDAKFPAALPDFETGLAGMDIAPGVSQSLPADLAPGLPEKDRPVLAAAIQHRCAVLLTGDKTHFGSLYGQTIKGVQVLSPASVAATLPPPRA
jgi:predicted nucleic acid-binding protein